MAYSQQKSYHTHSVSATVEDLHSSTVGLSNTEVLKRQQNGKNELMPPKRVSLFVRLLRQLNDPMIMVLIGAAIISAGIAIYEGSLTELADGGIILAIVIINAVIGLVQEGKAESALQALKDMSTPYCTVLREGQESRIDAKDLVVGDIVSLQAGDSIPADLRLTGCVSLVIEESALTGESVGVSKHTEMLSDANVPLGDRKNMAYSSSTVLYGRGTGIVTSIGMNTEVGKIAAMLGDKKVERTPLQRQLAKTANFISVGIMLLAGIIFVSSLFNDMPVIDAFMTSVAIAVAAIPEGLPAIVTIVLAVGVRKMSMRRAIVRNIPAVEVLGGTQVICSDKTGTLTQNKMTVAGLYTYRDGYYSSQVAPRSSAQTILTKGMIFCNDTKLSKSELLGDPTETALVSYAQKHSMYSFDEYSRIDELPFDSDRKLMTVLMQRGDAKIAYTKGSNDAILARCSHILDGDSIRPIDRSDIVHIKQDCDKMSTKALRCLGLAIQTDLSHGLERSMTFVGIVGMIDPPRPEVAAAIQLCKKAGIKTVMITGDHVVTAMAIAQQIGIQGKAMTGAELDAKGNEWLSANILGYGIFARVSPQNKVRIVKAFKNKALIVAMTGDGVNDAPSISEADIGIGMGITGTDVSKEAADMVLADDNFATIVGAVEEGRKIYANIKKSIRLLLSSNIAEVLALFVVSVFLRQPFLTPIMILMVNLITDSLPALALGLERTEKDVMSHSPNSSRKSLFAGRMGMQIVLQGVLLTALVMLTYIISVYGLPNLRPRFAMAMVFVTLITVQLFHSYNCKSERSSLFASNPFSNPLLNISFVVGLGVVLSVIYIPAIRTFFDLPILSFVELLVAIGIAALILPIVELYKYVERKIDRAV